VTLKVTMVWSCEKGNGGRSVEISASIGEYESRKTRKTRKDIVKRDFELIVAYESVALDRGRWRKIIASPTPT